MSQSKDFIQYGDIIQINEKVFFVNYVSSTKLELINEDDPDKTIYNIDNGVILDEGVGSIEILSREDNPSYAFQNNLTIGVWVTIEFGGSIPLVITGEITDIEEDMIEIKQVDEDEKLYIDFAYKGLPPELMIQKITIRDDPTIEMKEEIETSNLEKTVEEALIDGEAVNLDIKFDTMIEIVDVPEDEYRYLIEEQTNDLLEKLLSKIGTHKRNSVVMRENQKLVNRFIELRQHYSKFENYNVIGWKEVNINPIVEFIENMDETLKWVIPITKYIKKIYNVEDIDEELLDVNFNTTEDQLKKEEALDMAYEMNTIKSDNILKAYNNQLDQYYKPFDFLKLSEDVTTVKSRSKMMLIDNLGDYTSTVICNEELNTKKYVTQNILKNEKVSVIGYMILPEAYQDYYTMYLPTTSIMSKSDLSRTPFYYSKYLKDAPIHDNNLASSPICGLYRVNVIDSLNVFPTINSIIDCVELRAFSLHEMVEYLYLYKATIDSIDWATGQKILNIVNKTVDDYKKKIVTIQKKIRPYKVQTPELSNIKHIFADEKYEELLNAYGILKPAETMPYYSDSELIQKMTIDMGQYLYILASEQNASLRTAINFESLSKYVDANHDFHTMSCDMPSITKKYTLQEELENDNGKDIYVDREYDDTDYTIRSEFSAEQSKMSSSEFKSFLKKVLLERNIGGPSEEGIRQYLENLLQGRKLIIDGDYAVSKIFQEDQLQTKYYVRRNNVWMEDDNIDILCNLNKSCIQSQDECKSFYEKNATIQEHIAKEIMSESSKIKSLEGYGLSGDLTQVIENLKYLKNYNIRKQLYYNNNKIQIAKLLDDTSVLESPFEDVKNQLLKDTNIVTYYENIQMFVTNYTRSAINDENPNWLYCADTGLKLLPKFIYTLANSFITYNNFNETLQEICDEFGTLSDDGNSIVDKNSGYVIKKIELEYVDEYTDGGFKSVYHDTLDEEYEFKTEKTRKEADVNKKINNIILAVSGYMGLSLKEEVDFIIKHTIRILDSAIGSKDDYAITMGKTKKDNYEVAYHKALICITLGLMVIAIQVSTPSLKTSKTFPGCVKSLEGAPVYGDGPGCIQYVACIASKIKTHYEPWVSIRKMDEIRLSNSVKIFMEKFMLSDLEITRRIKDKQHYLLQGELEDLQIAHYQTWSDFMPLLDKVKIKSYEPLSPSFYKQLDKYITHGDIRQVGLLNILYGKFYHNSLCIQEEMQNVINKEEMLLKNNMDEPFLENSCCTSNDYLAMLYFITKNPQIKTVLSRTNELIMKIQDIKSLEKSPLFIHDEDTRVPILLPSIEFSEEIVYRTFIKLCNLDNKYPIPHELKSFIDKKPGQEYNPNEEQINIKIDRLKTDGYNLNETDLLNALSIMSKQNVCKDRVTTHVNKKKRFIELIELMQEDSDSFIDDLILHGLYNVIESPDNSSVIIKLNDDMKDKNTEMQDEIIGLLRDSGLVTKKDLTNLSLFLNNYSVFECEFFSNELQIMNNQIQTLLASIPQWLHNSIDVTSFKLPSYWGLSENHKMDIMANPRIDQGKKMGFVAKYYEDFIKYLDNDVIVEHLQSIVDELAQVKTFLDCTPNYGTYITSENLKVDRVTMQYLHHYLFLKIITIYISSTDNLEIIQFIIDILKTFMNDKTILNKNYENVMNMVLRDKETEKDKKTTYLKDLTSDERSVDNILKKHKIGKWGIGLEKGLVSYDKDFYDAERSEEMLDEFFNQNKMDNMLEENDLSLFGNDDDFADGMDGDERF